MRLEGTLDAFSLPDIFQLLSFTKKTGALHLRRADTHGLVHFSTGSVTGASSDAGRHPLARRIVGSGCAGDDALAAAVDRVAGDPGVGLARALRDAGAADEGLLHGLIAEQAVDAVFDLLRWPDGDFAFVVDEANPDDLGVALPVDEIVTEARRRLDYWQAVCRTIPSPDSVLALVATPAGEPAVNRDEWALLGLVDGRRSVAEMVALLGRGEFAVVSALAALVERGLVAVRQGDDGDAATVLVRRLQLLSRLDGVEAPVTVSHQETRTPAFAAEAAPAATHLTVPHAAVPASVTAHETHAVPPAVPAPATVTMHDSGHYDRNVTPARPEPFLPRRVPDHPEDQMLNASVVSHSVGPVVGSTAVAASPAVAAAPGTSPYIERDPSVNKSLLLRLIAGVRGL